MEDYLTTRKAADLIAQRDKRTMSALRIQQLCRRGDFPGATRPARDWLIPKKDVEAWRRRPVGNPGHFPREERR